jgi:TolA-binding protein
MTADAEQPLWHWQPEAPAPTAFEPARPESLPAPPPRRGSDTAVESARDTSEYERAVAAYAAHEYADAARRCAAFVVAQPDAPETEDATFLEASSLAHDGRTAAAGSAAERYLARYGRASFHGRDAAVLAARAARDRADCQRARELLAPWNDSSAAEVATALGSCRE